MADLILYTNPMSRGRIARWMLEEAGCAYDVEVLGYDGAMRGEAYRAVNPMMKVPAIRHGDRIVTECAAICAYLADTFPAADLAPASDARADYYRWLFFAAGPLEQAIGDRAIGAAPTPEQTGMIGYGDYDRTVDTLEGVVARGPFVAGDRFSAADVYLGSHVIWGIGFGTLPKRDAFVDYAERLTARDAYRRAAAMDDALMPPEDGGASAG